MSIRTNWYWRIAIHYSPPIVRYEALLCDESVMQPSSTEEPCWNIRYDTRWGFYTYWLLQHLKHVKFQVKGGFIYRLQHLSIAWIFVPSVFEQSCYRLCSQVYFFMKNTNHFQWRTQVIVFLAAYWQFTWLIPNQYNRDPPPPNSVFIADR